MTQENWVLHYILRGPDAYSGRQKGGPIVLKINEIVPNVAIWTFIICIKMSRVWDIFSEFTTKMYQSGKQSKSISVIVVEFSNIRVELLLPLTKSGYQFFCLRFLRFVDFYPNEKLHQAAL